MAHLWNALAAAARPDTALHQEFGERRTVAVEDLLALAETTAAELADRLNNRTAPRLGILMANGEPWVRALLAALRLDGVAVPLPLPVAFGGVDAYAEHLHRITEAAELDAILVDGSVGERVQQRVAQALSGVLLIDIARAPSAGARLAPVGIGGDRPAVIQFTSGSTRTPKGVVLSHHNILAGLDAIAVGSAWRDDERMGLWLPLFHDMGLFSMLAAFSRGSSVHLWRPGDFIRRPMQWLAEFAAAGVTAMPAPNFCYDLLVAEAAQGVPEGLNLARWRHAGNGAEPVRAATMARFTETFSPHGMRHGLLTMYGMAEATLAATMSGVDDVRTLHVDRSALGEGETVRPATPGSDSDREVVSCGRPLHNISVRIGTADGSVLGEGVVGEIQLSGPAVTRGYLNLPDVEQPFTADGWLRTGDLAFLDDGELFVVGRAKDMIVVRGANYYAEDVEEIARSTPGFGRSRCAAFAWQEPDRERIVLLWETDDAVREADLATALRRRVTERLGTDLLEIVPVPRSSIPYTTSGKVKRTEARKLASAVIAPPTAATTAVPGHSEGES